MKRTYVLTFAILVLATAVFSSESQAQAKVPRVGMLLLSQETLKIVNNASFIGVLTERGWVPGKNVALEYRFARGEAFRFGEVAEELVELKVDVIVAFSAPATRAAYEATRTIPIVAQDLTNDPVAAGYADSYSRPGKNLTGVFLDAPEFAGKWIELLRAIVPGLQRVAVLWDPAPGATHLKALQSVAKPIGLQVQVYEVRVPDDLDKAFSAFRDRPQAVIIVPSPLTYTHSRRLAELALKSRLPATSIARAFAEAGGAVAYGSDINETTLRNAIQVAKILDGTKVGDLPIERPTKFDFVINMKTMKALGLKVPTDLLLGAEQVGR